MSDLKVFEPQTAVYSPAQVSAYGVQEIERLKSNKMRTLGIGIAGLRDYFAPMRPGQVCAVIAQTSHYKSGFLHCVERMAAQALKASGRGDECLVHISVEEGIEEQAFMEFARESGERADALARGKVQDWTRLMQAAIRVADIPIYRIGDSLARAEDMPNLYMSNMLRSIEELQRMFEPELKIAGLFFDYLQAFPIDPEIRTAVHEQQRRLQVRDDIYRLRQAAARFSCPVFVAVQGKQHLEGAAGPNMLIPGIYDGEESSSIAQRADRIIQLWMPKQTHSIGATIKHKSHSFRVDENLIWIKVGKQRGGLPSGKTFKCRINYQSNTIAPEALELPGFGEEEGEDA